MKQATSQYHYPANIKLKKNSLAEAWLEIRWKIEEDKQLGIQKDPNFEIALGIFSKNVREHFPSRIGLDASRMPAEMLPYVVRYQFRESEESWPVLQIGPGVASVNFTQPYTWEMFSEKAHYLRSQLIEAYEQEIITQAAILRYRNAIPFSYSSQNVLEFLSSNLNVTIQHPSTIPGYAGTADNLTDINTVMVFNLKVPKGKGIIKIATGKKGEKDPSPEDKQLEAIVFELEVSSTQTDAPSLTNEKEFSEWLKLAHLAIHDWYFSLIAGPLREQFEKEGE